MANLKNKILFMSCVCLLGFHSKVFASSQICASIFTSHHYSLEKLEAAFQNLAQDFASISEPSISNPAEKQRILNQLGKDLKQIERLAKELYPHNAEKFSSARFKELSQKIYNDRSQLRIENQKKKNIQNEERKKEIEKQTQHQVYADGEVIDAIELAIRKDDPVELKRWLPKYYLNLDYKNISGFSIIEIAINYNRLKIIDAVLNDPQFNPSDKNKDGLNVIEFALSLDKQETAEYLKVKLPHLQYNAIKVQERTNRITTDYPKGVPYFGFVSLEPGTFRMRDSRSAEGVTATLTKAYELMSTKTTQKLWMEVIQLGKKYLDPDLRLMEDPSDNKGKYYPVDSVTREDVLLWLEVATQLSRKDNKELQDQLGKIFPGHYQGALYLLPTEAQWEYAARLGGLANGLYSHSSTYDKIGSYAWYENNSRNKVHSVGGKKPAFINSKPVYDLHGNALEIVRDLGDEGASLPGGTDPFVDNGNSYIMRGSSYVADKRDLQSGARQYGILGSSYKNVSFRIIRMKSDE